MATAANVDATAVNTIGWLAAGHSTIVVPVYQRQYRWDIGGCEQLLADIRAVGDSHDAHTHFIGSILSTESAANGTTELVLIDGQQRITTLMLLVAALHHTVREHDDDLATELAQVLVHDVAAGGEKATKLRPHREWADVFRSVVLDVREDGDDLRDSRFDDNYAFFRSQVGLDEVPRIWRGLQKLEHVSITLGVDANAQQIFESLNSTGAPLRDHELIHNYVLMGLSHAEQSEIEDEYWLPIERNTGDAIGPFWRHYLVMKTGREVAVAGEHGVYDAFRHEFPRLDLAMLREHAAEWREFSGAYRILADPTQESDPDIARQLAYVNTFGRGISPLTMRGYRDHARGDLSKADLIALLELVQSLLLRRTVVGIGNERIVARLCRARMEGTAELIRATARITPSDERVRMALKYGELPHPAYILSRVSDVTDARDLEVAHVLPLAPGDTWSPDGVRMWGEYTEDEQNSHRALAQTLGNLVLLEEPLAERAFGASYPEARTVYLRGGIAVSRQAAEPESWGTAAISERTSRLTDRFVEVWVRPAIDGIDDDGLTPILDAVRRRGWPRGWQREFDYTEYRGEHWEVHDVKALFNRVFKRLWADSRSDVEAFSARRGGPIYEAQAWNGHWDTLDDNHFLFMGWDSKYMLTAVQGVLEEAGLAAEVFVKYSYIAAHM
jgi:hypothetical protein